LPAVSARGSEMYDFILPSELIEQVKRDNVVLLCGAGISASVGGVPSGSQLAQELAKRIGLSDISGLTLPEIAQAYELELGHHSLITYLVDRIDNARFLPLPTHQLIAELPFNAIMTTNWDNLLEEALRQAHKPLVKVVQDTDIAFADNHKTLLVKLHGSVEQRDSIVVTGDDYLHIFTRLPETINLTRSYFATRTLLFLGFGLADDDFKRLYLDVERNLGRNMRRAYAVQLNPTPVSIKYWQTKNVEVINADVTDFLRALKLHLS
jgi:SIR2-like protein